MALHGLQEPHERQEIMSLAGWVAAALIASVFALWGVTYVLAYIFSLWQPSARYRDHFPDELKRYRSGDREL